MADTSLQQKPLIRPLRSIGLWILAIVLITIAPHALAQSQDITLDTPATTDKIQNWLSSGDPRLIAWGAHFARERDDKSALASIVPLLAQQTPATDQLNPDSRATMAMLDALIQRGESIPANTIAVVAPSFPAQAAILAARLPIVDATPLLLNWYSQRSGKDTYRLSRIAAMLLSHAPPPGFAASVVAESEESLFITVTSPGSKSPSGTGTASCGDGMGTPPPSGWPPIYTYMIAENQGSACMIAENQGSAWQPFVEASGDCISYPRRNLYGGWGSCTGDYPSALNASNRHFLLAQMLGSTPNEISWETYTGVSIAWKSDAQFLREGKAKVAFEEKKLRATVTDLRAIGLLAPEEAASVRPKLTVTISDSRNPARSRLPKLTFADPRTVVVTARGQW